MIDRQINLLQQLALFGGINETTLRIILKKSTCVTINSGEVFFNENDSPNGMYVLEKGHVEIYKNWEGEEYKLSELKAGDCFGEMALVDCGIRSASVRATVDSQAIQIPGCTLTEIARHDIEQFALIQMNMGREICRRLRKADELIFQCVLRKCKV